MQKLIKCESAFGFLSDHSGIMTFLDEIQFKINICWVDGSWFPTIKDLITTSTSFKFMLLLLLLSTVTFAQENCANGLDDDGDGLIDLNDVQNCFCEGLSMGSISNMIPNPSFEEMECCPWMSAQVSCATDWFQATMATTDYLNNCGVVYGYPPTPFPHGNGIMGSFVIPNGENSAGGWLEYLGACLESPLLAGETYSLEFNVSATFAGAGEGMQLPDNLTELDITIWGFESCGTFPLPTTGCPEPLGWYEVGSVTYSPALEWSQQTITFSPSQDTESIMLGPPCNVDNSYLLNEDNPALGLYFFYDNLVMLDPLYLDISQTGGGCIDDLVLSVVELEEMSYQWYYEGVALTGETTNSLNLGIVYEEGNYQVMISDLVNGECAVSEISVYEVSITTPINLEANILSGCAPLEVEFTNMSSPDFEGEFIWDFEIASSSASNPIITFYEEGFYSVTLTGETDDGCTTSITYEDYIEIFDLSPPAIFYSQLSVCSPYNLIFESDAIGEELEFEWSFGDIGLSTDISPLIMYENAGGYIVNLDVVNSQTGCSASSSVEIEVEENLPVFHLSAPTSICHEGARDTIWADFGNGFVNWTGGLESPFLEITEPGLYHAIFTRADGCEAIDSVYVAETTLPKLHASDKVACAGDPVQLYADSDAPSVYWENVSNSHVAIVYDEGIYKAVAENECGISKEEIEVVLNDCTCQIYVPNSFSPNGDGINDLFKPIYNCDFAFYELSIFNRWGDEIFVTQDSKQSWNGSSAKSSNYYTENELFHFIIKYDNALYAQKDYHILRGTILILR